MGRTSSTTQTGFLSLGEVANRLGCQLWQVSRIFDRELLPAAQRIGRNRVVPESRLAEIRLVLREAGFLKAGAR